MKASEIFGDAARILIERGHCKGDFVDDHGSVCAAGAIDIAAGEDPGGFRGDEYRAVEDLLEEDTALSRWNDDAWRTPEEVIAILDAAYVVALQEEGLEPEDVLT